MIKIILVESITTALEDGTSMLLAYYLTVDVSRLSNMNMYGIKVVKDTDSEFESEITGPISYSRDFVKRLCLRLAKYSVTPITLLEVVDDLLTPAI